MGAKVCHDRVAGVHRRLRQQALLQFCDAAESHAREHGWRILNVLHPAVTVQLPLRGQRGEPGARRAARLHTAPCCTLPRCTWDYRV